MQTRVFRQIHFPHAALAKLRADFIATEFCARSQRHFFRSAVQFSTTFIGIEVISPAVFATKNFWPSAVTANCATAALKLGTRKSNRGLGAPLFKVPSSSLTSTAIIFLSLAT